MELKKNEPGQISRRRFLVLTGGTICSIALGCRLPRTRIDHVAAVEFPESSCGKKSNKSGKILVAYASRCGSTVGVAETIGQTLCDRGATVDVRLAKNITDMSPYRAVVVGSAIRKGKWLPEAVKFVKNHQEVLSQVPVAYFLVCMKIRNPTEKNYNKVLAYLEPVHRKIPQVQPVDIGLFAGALDYSCLSGLTRLIVKIKGEPEGDFRDWDAIRAWAAGLRLTNEKGQYPRQRLSSRISYLDASSSQLNILE